jgi:hypothetical protein
MKNIIQKLILKTQENKKIYLLKLRILINLNNVNKIDNFTEKGKKNKSSLNGGNGN